jgi:alternate signal-mediated exported protein
MASKSKKRRRVLGASCILAALIIAGSSFAWFTSKDEVTNRLSASGDYDVSIVESFAPPAKWVPGQAVNKDVYAVNTGNVEAFVKESVTSVMTIVTEDAYKTTDDKPDEDSITLTPAERYVVEAGAFLAYAPAGSKYTDADGKVVSGLKAVAMSPEPRQTEYDYEATSATDFTPDVEGLYVFRRTIGVDDKTQLENYTYDAYYFVPGTGKTTAPKTQATNKKGELGWTNDGGTSVVWAATKPTPASGDPDYVAYEIDAHEVDGVDGVFYKVSDLAVKPEGATFAGDQDQRDGMVDPNFNYETDPSTGAVVLDGSGNPTLLHNYGFYKDVTKTVVPTLTYDKLNNRLVASYNTGVTKTNDELRALAKTYQDAAIDYQDALEEYAAALGDEVGRAGINANGDLAQATKTLRDKVDKLLAAQYAQQAAQKAYDDAYAEMLVLKAASEAAAEELSGAQQGYGKAGDGDANKDTIMGRYERAEKALGSDGDGTTTSAWGKENAAEAARDTALGNATPGAESGYLGAKAIREAATQSERYAFLDLVIAKAGKTVGAGTTGETTVPDTLDDNATDVNRTNAAAYLDGLTYDQMVALGIENLDVTDPNAYSYYTKLINEKEAKENLDKKEAAYEQAILDRKEAQRTFDIAKEAKEAAEAALGNTADLTNEDESTAAGRAHKAARLYKEKMEQLYGQTSTSTDYGVNGSETTGHYDPAEYDATGPSGSLYGTLQARKTDTANAQAAKDAAQGAYDTALTNSNIASTNVTNAANRVAQTRQARDNAWAAYETAYNATTGELKININLADVVTEGGVADKWQLLPESLEDVYKNDDITTPGVNLITKATDTKTDTASFYYTSILGGGETSAKLIDSVELDPSVTKEMFKYFDFDLNITLNSAQVNIDENGNYTAETAQSELGKYAILTDNTSADTAITWSDTSTIPESAKAKKYQGTFTDGTPNTYTDKEITELTTPQIFDYVDYNYVTVINGKTYYGTGVGADAKFYKYDATTGTLLKANTDEVQDNVLTLGVAAKRKYTKTVTFKNTTDTTVADTTADYTYVEGGSWTGTAPTGASEFCATENGTYSTIQAALGSAADGTATVYYHTA